MTSFIDPNFVGAAVVRREMEAKKPGEVVCPFCSGRGEVRDPKDRPPDPVEGYKFREYVTCTACGGKGSAVATSRRGQGFQGYLNAVEDAIDRETRLHMALAKLTPEEKELLGLVPTPRGIT